MGITADVSATGCRIISPRLLRPGSQVMVTLSSDLVPDELDVLGEAVWATSDQLAVSFGRPVRNGALTGSQWLAKVLESRVDSAASPPVGPGAAVRPAQPIPIELATTRPRAHATGESAERRRGLRRV